MTTITLSSRTHGSETRGSETRGSETRGSETHGSETRGSEMYQIWNIDRLPPINILDFIELLNTEEETSVETTEDTDDTTDEQKLLAIENYERHYNMEPGTATIEAIKISSAGIQGWFEDTKL